MLYLLLCPLRVPILLSPMLSVHPVHTHTHVVPTFVEVSDGFRFGVHVRLNSRGGLMVCSVKISLTSDVSRVRPS